MSKHQTWANRPQTCEECGKHFESVRYNAVYCSAKCRMAHKRKLDRIDILKRQALEALEELWKYDRKDGQERAFLAASAILRSAKSTVQYLEN